MYGSFFFESTRAAICFMRSVSLSISSNLNRVCGQRTAASEPRLVPRIRRMRSELDEAAIKKIGLKKN